MAKITPRNRFFLFRMIDPDSKLERDEPSVVTRVLCLSAFILLIIDLLVVVFFLKTKARIDAMIADPFTQAIIQVIDECDRTQGEYVQKTREYIGQKNTDIRFFASELATFSGRISQETVPALKVDELPQLKTLLAKIEKSESPSPLDINQAATLFNQAEKSIKKHLDSLKNLDLFIENFRSFLSQIDGLVAEVQKILNVYLQNVLSLANRQNKNQMELYKQVKTMLVDFEEIYRYVYRDNSYTTLNNIYKSKFLEFENDFVPFSQVIYDQYNAAKLTETAGIELALPRIYYCTLQAYITGLGNFGVKFEFVDHGMDGREIVLASTEEIRGRYKDPISVSEMQVFELPKGRHNLYLRILSQSGSSQLRMRDLAHECVSYRNFHSESH